jgi:hypothetical protein
MSLVKAEATVWASGGRVVPEVIKSDCCTGLEAELETTVDQALIRGLGTAFRVFVSGLSSV